MKIRSLLSVLLLSLVAFVGNAQNKAPEDFSIIEKQPEGELRIYTRTGFTLNEDLDNPGTINTNEQEGIVNMVYAEDNVVYMQFPVTNLNALYNAWIRGTRSADGSTLTFPVGQYVCYTRSFDMAVQIWMMKAAVRYNEEEGRDLNTFVVDEDVTDIVFSVATDGTLTLQGTDETHILSAVNRAFGNPQSADPNHGSGMLYLDFEWISYGDYSTVLTISNDMLPMPPTGLQTQTLTATTGFFDGFFWSPYNEQVSLGFDGDDVWLQGITTLLPGAWAKGTRNGNTLTFESGQLLGYYNGVPLYLIATEPDSEGEPKIRENFTFEYDGDGSYTSYNDILVSTSFTNISFMVYYMGLTLSMKTDQPVVVPENLRLREYTMSYQEPDASGRLIRKSYKVDGAFKGNKFYLHGITPYVPDAYIVGTIDDFGLVTFPSPQYLGTFFDEEESGIDYPLYFQAFHGTEGTLLPSVAFGYDDATQTLTPVDATTAISIGFNKTGLLATQYIYNMTLTPTTIIREQTIGYCNSELPDNMQPLGIGEGQQRISAAIHLPRTKLMRYQGSAITKIRFAVKKGFENMSVWIRTSLDTSSKVVQSVTEVNDGTWTEIELNTPLEIDGSDLYIGYTATQPNGFHGILSYGEGNAYTSWLAVGNQWDDYHTDGVGILCIEAVAEGEVSERGAAVISLVADKQCLAPTETLIVSGEVENLSSTDLQGYTLTYTIDGVTVATQTANQLLRPDEVAAFSYELSLDGYREGSHELAVVVDDGTHAPHQMPAITFYVYETAYPRTLLLEHFTSLPCVNCPEVDVKLEEVVEGRSDVAWVSHHVGYKDDEFTLETERSLTRFGVNGNPYIMLDRTAFNEGEPPAFTIGSYTVPQIGTIFDYAVTMPAFMQLHATATAGDGMLTVTVEGEGKSFIDALFPRAALHVYLLEDEVEAVESQAGDANKRFHDNILRAVVTPARGMLPEWQGQTGCATFQAVCNASLDATWNTSHLRVVAFLTAQAPTGSGYPTGQVLNTAQTTVGDANAIQTVVIPSQQTGQWTTLDGRRISTPVQSGIYLRNGKKIIISK